MLKTSILRLRCFLCPSSCLIPCRILHAYIHLGYRVKFTVILYFCPECHDYKEKAATNSANTWGQGVICVIYVICAKSKSSLWVWMAVWNHLTLVQVVWLTQIKLFTVSLTSTLNSTLNFTSAFPNGEICSRMQHRTHTDTYIQHLL